MPLRVCVARVSQPNQYGFEIIVIHISKKYQEKFMYEHQDDLHALNNERLLLDGAVDDYDHRGSYE